VRSGFFLCETFLIILDCYLGLCVSLLVYVALCYVFLFFPWPTLVWLCGTYSQVDSDLKQWYTKHRYIIVENRLFCCYACISKNNEM
jgi:hypothetical protein